MGQQDKEGGGRGEIYKMNEKLGKLCSSGEDSHTILGYLAVKHKIIKKQKHIHNFEPVVFGKPLTFIN